MASNNEQIGRNLSQEIDELKDMIAGQTVEFKSLLMETLDKARGNFRTNNQGTAFVNPFHVDSTPCPPGYEPNHVANQCGGEYDVRQLNQRVGEINQSYPGVNFAKEVTRNLEEMTLKEELEQKMQEQIKALRRPSPYGPMGIKELCLTPNVLIPKDFKMPDFVKFDGSSNPIMHLKMYCTKMGIWSQEENFFISFFPESLDGAALEWYMQLDQSQIKCWEDLALAFTNQYKFNLNTAPTRDQLKGMKKNHNESFKEYAQRWRAVAAQVIPPMLESEMCSYFIRTLEGPFFETMLGTLVKEFVDLIEIGERIEANIQEGRVELIMAESSEQNSEKGQFQKKKGKAVNSVQASYSSQPYHSQNPLPQLNHTPPHHNTPYQFPTPHPHHPYQGNFTSFPHPIAPANSFPHQTLFPIHQSSQAPARYKCSPKPSQPRDTRPLPNFGMSKSELFKHLCKENLVAPRYAKPVTPPYPQWYNPNVACEYHSNTVGHSIDDCVSFRAIVWRLIKDKFIEVPGNA